MKPVHVLYVGFFSLLLPICSQAQTGRIKGTAFDPNEAVIAGLKIKVEKVSELDGGPSEEFEREAVTDEEGSYEFELPPGVYSVETESRGFLPFTRADFVVLPNSSTMINLAPRPPSAPVGVLYVGPPDKAPRFPKDKEPEVEEFTVKHPSGVPLEVRIEYFGKKRRGGLSRYREVVMSYNTLIVYADNLTLDTKGKRGRMQALGNVVVEDGRRRLKANKVVVELEFDESGNLKYTVD